MIVEDEKREHRLPRNDPPKPLAVGGAAGSGAGQDGTGLLNFINAQVLYYLLPC